MSRTSPEIDAIAAFITEQQRHNPRRTITEASIHGVIKPKEFAEAVWTAISLTDTGKYWDAVADAYKKPKNSGAAIKRRAAAWLETFRKQVRGRRGMSEPVPDAELKKLNAKRFTDGQGNSMPQDYAYYWTNTLTDLQRGELRSWDRAHTTHVHTDMIGAGEVDPTLLRALTPTLQLFGISPSQFEDAMWEVISHEPSYMRS